MNKKLFALMLIPILLAAGCRPKTAENGTPVTVYTLAQPESHTALETRTLSCPEGGRLWETALEGVLSGAGGRAAFPAGTAVTEFILTGGVATVVLSEEASSLAGFALTQARACVVLTLTGLDGVDGVILLIEGQITEPVTLRASDFVIDSLVLADTERSITLFFPDETGERAMTERRTLVVRETDTVDWYLGYMLKQMIAGPKTPGLRPVLPEGTRLLTVLVEGGVCTVNFSGEFASNLDTSGISDRMTLYCLVRSVTAQPGVSSLRLLTDGLPLDLYGTVDTSQPLTADDVR